MEKRDRYTPKQKLEIVLEGLRGETSITELCRKYRITSGMYYKWRDLLLRKDEEIFANQGNFAFEKAYIEKIREMERVIGRLVLETRFLKKQIPCLPNFRGEEKNDILFKTRISCFCNCGSI